MQKKKLFINFVYLLSEFFLNRGPPFLLKREDSLFIDSCSFTLSRDRHGVVSVF